MATDALVEAKFEYLGSIGKNPVLLTFVLFYGKAKAADTVCITKELFHSTLLEECIIVSMRCKKVPTLLVMSVTSYFKHSLFAGFLFVSLFSAK